MIPEALNNTQVGQKKTTPDLFSIRPLSYSFSIRALLCLIALFLIGCKSQGLSEAEIAALPDVETLELWPYDPPIASRSLGIRRKTQVTKLFTRDIHTPTVEVFHAKGENRTGAAVVICPGGSYHIVSHVHEGQEVAKRFSALGITAVVLRYRMHPYRFPVPKYDVQRAIQTIRANALPWGLDPGRVGVMGFSAGGHLASIAAVYHTPAEPGSPDPICRVTSRPDFAILVYPVISMRVEITYDKLRKYLIGLKDDEQLIAELSTDEHVTALTPPTFLVHAKDDYVKIEHSELFLAALKKHNVQGELMALSKGRHGFGLGGGPDNEAWAWPDRCILWLEQIGMIELPR